MLHPAATINEGGEAYLNGKSGGDVSTEAANARKMNQQVAEMSSNAHAQEEKKPTGQRRKEEKEAVQGGAGRTH